jgi:hypothetical protein
MAYGEQLFLHLTGATEENQNNFSHNIRFLDRNLNPGPPEYETEDRSAII